MNDYDYFVQERKSEFVRDCLHQPLFAVNIRLMKSSDKYLALINQSVDYLKWAVDQHWNGYGSCTSIAAANLGIPWNIVIHKKFQEKRVFLNPEIIEYSPAVLDTTTNCPSVNLKTKLKINRSISIVVRYFDMEGQLNVGERFERNNGSFALQHEIDLNNGILITDRYIIQGNNPENIDKS